MIIIIIIMIIIIIIMIIIIIIIMIIIITIIIINIIKRFSMKGTTRKFQMSYVFCFMVFVYSASLRQ